MKNKIIIYKRGKHAVELNVFAVSQRARMKHPALLLVLHFSSRPYFLDVRLSQSKALAESRTLRDKVTPRKLVKPH